MRVPPPLTCRRLALLITSLLIAIQVGATPGNLDTSFSGDGIFTNPSGGAPIQLPSGKLLLIGSFGGKHTFTRVNANGTVDATYANAGIYQGPVGTTIWGFNYLPADGTLFAHTHFDTSSLVTLNDAAVLKYNVNGSIDTTFGTSGRAIFRFDGTTAADEQATATLVQADGKIVVGGYIFYDLSNVELALARLTAAGALDTAFGTGGRVVIDVNGGIDKIWGLIPQADGKFIAYGEAQESANINSPSAIVFMRFSADGVLDTTFGTGGKTLVRTDVNTDTPGATRVLADGSILFAIGGTAQYTVGKLTPEGQLDSSFGTNGIASQAALLTGVTYPAAQSVGLAVQPNGRIVVAAWLSGATPSFQVKYSTGVARFNPNGSVDSTFGVNGQVQVNVTDANPETISGCLVQADGKIVVGGTITGIDFYAYRLEGDGTAHHHRSGSDRRPLCRPAQHRHRRHRPRRAHQRHRPERR